MEFVKGGRPRPAKLVKNVRSVIRATLGGTVRDSFSLLGDLPYADLPARQRPACNGFLPQSGALYRDVNEPDRAAETMRAFSVHSAPLLPSAPTLQSFGVPESGPQLLSHPGNAEKSGIASVTEEPPK